MNKQITNILIGGPMGSGKSTLAKSLSKYLNIKITDIDEICEPESSTRELIWNVFEKVYRYNNENKISSIYVATFSFRETRDKFLEIGDKYKNNTFPFFISCSTETCANNINKRDYLEDHHINGTNAAEKLEKWFKNFESQNNEDLGAKWVTIENQDFKDNHKLINSIVELVG